jgi:hypothetical protein
MQSPIECSKSGGGCSISSSQLRHGRAVSFEVCPCAAASSPENTENFLLGYTHLAERAGSILQMNTELDVRSLISEYSIFKLANMHDIRPRRHLTNTPPSLLKHPLPPAPKHSPSSALSACGTLPQPNSSGYSTLTLPAPPLPLCHQSQSRPRRHRGRTRRTHRSTGNSNGRRQRRARPGIVLLGIVSTSRSSRGCCSS